MKQSAKIVLIMLVLIGTCACSRKSVAVQSEITHDTLVITNTIIERDTIIQVAGALLSYQLPVPIPHLFEGIPEAKNGVIAKQIAQATMKLTYKDNHIRIDCGCDTVKLKAKLYDTFQKELRKTVIEKTVVHRQRFVPKAVKVLAWSGGIFYLLVIIGLLRKFNVI